MANEDDEGYEYHQGTSTALIFFRSGNNSLGVLRKHQVPVRELLLPNTPGPKPIICSSSKGLIACRQSSVYFIGNPFCEVKKEEKMEEEESRKRWWEEEIEDDDDDDDDDEELEEEEDGAVNQDEEDLEGAAMDEDVEEESEESDEDMEVAAMDDDIEEESEESDEDQDENQESSAMEEEEEEEDVEPAAPMVEDGAAPMVGDGAWAQELVSSSEEYDDGSTDDEDDCVIEEAIRPVLLDGGRYCKVPLPPKDHSVDDTEVILCVHPALHRELDSLVLMCVHKKPGDTRHTFSFYNSLNCRWASSRYFDLRDQIIIRNTGVSCSNKAHWLLGKEGSQNPLCLLSVGFSSEDCSVTKVTTELPFQGPLPPSSRMQLGSVRNKLGAVVVDEAKSTVQLYIRQRDNETPPWTLFESFNVQLIAADGEENNQGGPAIASWTQENMTIVCQSMPRPIRFQSLKRVELLFWVQGRVMVLENSTRNIHRYRMTMLPEEASAGIIDGLPHVLTSLNPRDHIELS